MLAVGPGVTQLGERALAAVGEWWAPGPCVPRGDELPCLDTTGVGS